MSSPGGKRSDYFGKFLETLSDPGAPAETAGPAPDRQYVQAAPVTDLVDRTLSALRGGRKPLNDLLLPGDSISGLLSAIQTLQSLGYVDREAGDVFDLTDAGRAVAEKLAGPRPAPPPD